MTPPARGHPEAYEDFQVGDHVYCLAWIGMPFVIVGKDDNTGKIELDGLGPCSLPDGAKVDIDTPYMYMLSHNLGDQIWYRPDRAGETYDQVLARFVNGQGEDALVDGYVVTGWRVLPTPEMAATYRVSFDALNAWNQIFAQPVTAAAEDGKTRIVAYDESIPDDAWQPSGPATPLRLGMISYRWALSSGFVVLNWRDFLLDD